jgi:hypothetical protein
VILVAVMGQSGPVESGERSLWKNQVEMYSETKGLKQKWQMSLRNRVLVGPLHSQKHLRAG